MVVGKNLTSRKISFKKYKMNNLKMFPKGYESIPAPGSHVSGGEMRKPRR